MQVIELVFPEVNIKQRPRVSKHGGMYNPSESKEKEIIKEIKKQLPVGFTMIPLNVPVRMEAEFSFGFPKGLPKKYRFKHPHIKKKDLDNILKFIMDCMNEVVFEDDRQVYSSQESKYYDEETKTIIRIIAEDG